MIEDGWVIYEQRSPLLHASAHGPHFTEKAFWEIRPRMARRSFLAGLRTTFHLPSFSRCTPILVDTRYYLSAPWHFVALSRWGMKIE